MAASNFDASLKLVLQSEGGNDDDPADHGGRTSRGITQREYDAWCAEHNWPGGDIWKATDSAVASIYHDEYWNPYCDGFPVGIDYLYFDMAVNAGPARATKILQAALGVGVDGRLGPITRQAVAKADPIALIDDYSEAKASFYRGLHQPRFLKGWLNRTASVRAAAHTMVNA